MAVNLLEYLDRAIGECERDIRSLDSQLATDRDYVNWSGADPNDVDYYRCQIELNVIEKECLERKLAVLRRWVDLTAKPDDSNRTKH
jgi:hypothetical protein